ncbi:hypothetical protein RKD38_001346 [Streptomyces ambofaciens]
MRTALKEEVGRAQYPAFFRDMARLEARAAALNVYAFYAVPGLLQTEDYVRAVFHMQRPLLEDETFVIEEAVLRRPIGSRKVMRGALEQVLLTGQSRNVEVQVMPIDREDNAALGGPFLLIDTDNGSALPTRRYRTTVGSTPALPMCARWKRAMASSGHRR